MGLSGIVDINRLFPHPFQGKEKLFCLIDRTADIGTTMQQQGGCHDLCSMADWTALHGFAAIQKERLIPEPFIINIDITDTVECQPVGNHRACYGCFKTLILSHNPAGHVTAVTPTGDTQTLRVCNTGGNTLIDHSHQVTIIRATPVTAAGCRESGTIAAAATRIGKEYGIAL